MKESQRNSVRNLEYLYSTVVGLGLSLAIVNLIDTGGQTASLKLRYLPFFLALLVVLIPFYHGALRHLDATYVEGGGRQVRRGGLLVDFLGLFAESCVLLGLAVLIVNPSFFSWGLVGLLALDSLWALLAHLAFSQHSGLQAESRWSIINVCTAVVLAIYLLVIGVEPSTEYTGEMRLWLGVLGISLVRSVLDYKWCWDFYYPPK